MLDEGKFNLTHTEHSYLNSSLFIPKVAGVIGIIVPCITLLGWSSNITILRTFLPNQPQMVPNTAICFILASISLLLSIKDTSSRHIGIIARLLALVVITAASFTLLEYLLSADLNIDLLLFAEEARKSSDTFPGRSSPHTALSFLIFGSALTLLNAKAKIARQIAQSLALMTAFIALLAFIGYVYRVTNLYAISPQTGMALHTVLTFCILSLGALFAKPSGGWFSLLLSESVGGKAARQLLPAATLIPIALGGIIVAGAHKNLYDAKFGMAICVVGSIGALALLIGRCARDIHKTDMCRIEAEIALRKAHSELEERVKKRTEELSRVNEALQAEIVSHKGAQTARAQLLKQLVTAQEEERRRISRELHDHMGQHLSALMLRLKTLKMTQHAHTTNNANINQIEELTNQLVDSVHTLAWELRPPALDDLGLMTALSNYTEKWSQRSDVAIDFQCTGLNNKRFPPEIETTVYRAVQEALTNVLKHASARNVSLILERRPDHLLVLIEDDGKGFDETVALDFSGIGRSLGLLGMRERIALVGGALEIDSETGRGTTIVLRIPLSNYIESETFPREHIAHHFS